MDRRRADVEAGRGDDVDHTLVLEFGWLRLLLITVILDINPSVISRPTLESWMGLNAPMSGVHCIGIRQRSPGDDTKIFCLMTGHQRIINAA
jgi:hypothetical protein